MNNYQGYKLLRSPRIDQKGVCSCREDRSRFQSSRIENSRQKKMIRKSKSAFLMIPSVSISSLVNKMYVGERTVSQISHEQRMRVSYATKIIQMFLEDNKNKRINRYPLPLGSLEGAADRS